jgi:CubicO group peptidase (beta-lactamase class C family)
MGTWADGANRALSDALSSTGARVVAAGTVDGEDRCSIVLPTVHTKNLFEIGSITKTMTALVLAQLVLDEQTNLDQALGMWLDAGPNADVTLRQLATHTSGLPRMAANASAHDGFDESNPYAHYGGEAAAAALRTTLRGDGAREYSNFGYQLLGLCLERIANRPLQDLFQQYIFDPLGMTTASASAHERLLRGEEDGKPVPNWTMKLLGPGGVNATIADMVAYLDAVARPPAGPLGDAIRFTLEPHGPDGERLGWSANAAGLIVKNGGTGGFSSCMAIDPATGRGAVGIVNTFDSDAVDRLVIASARGDDPVALVDHPFEGDQEPWTEPSLRLFVAMARRDHEGARAMMTASTAEAITVERLQAGWSVLSEECGALEDPVVTEVAHARGAVTVTMSAAGTNRALKMKCWFDDDHRVIGLTIQ